MPIWRRLIIAVIVLCIVGASPMSRQAAAEQGLHTLGTSSGVCPGAPGTGEFTVLTEIFGRGFSGADLPPDVPFMARTSKIGGIYLAANCPVAWSIDVGVYRSAVNGPPPPTSSTASTFQILVLPGEAETFFDQVELRRVGLSGFYTGSGVSAFVSGQQYDAVFDPATGVLQISP